MTPGYEVGKQVVCIIEDWDMSWYRGPFPRFPRKGSIYTIRELRPYNDGTVGLRVEEIVSPPIKWGNGAVEEITFYIEGFRPVRDTSIEIFRRLLVTPPKELVE